MIAVDHALTLALAHAPRLESERVPLERALRRVLAEDVFADMDMPPFNKACVDGYACRRSDLHEPLILIETIPAGAAPKETVRFGQCAKIMTGAMLPEGAECVFMVEHSELLPDGRVRFTGDHTTENVVPRGQDVRAGDRLLEEGHRILPQDVAVLASMGYDAPFVARQPRVAVVATGDELVEPGQTPSISQIRNSNSYTLMALLDAAGAVPTYLGIARDSLDSLERVFAQGLEHDVICFSGGVSMGDFDFVPEILRKRGFEIKFEKVAVQPGKPTLFAVSDRTVCFGLPGNPVSTFVTFDLFVRPFLWKMMGHDYTPPRLRLPLEKGFERKNAAREAWVPVVLTDEGGVALVDYHGSAHFHALSCADGLMRIESGITEIEPDALVTVRLIRS